MDANRLFRCARAILLAITALLLIVPIATRPVGMIPLFTAENSAVNVLGGTPEVKFGAYGYCVSISTFPVDEWCSDPTFGYDITHVVYQSINETQIFSLDVTIDIASDSSATQLTKALAVLFPVALFYSVIALAFSIFCRRNIVVIVMNCWCFGHTVAALGLSLGFNSRVKDFWVTNGPNNHGTGDIGPGNVCLTVAFMTQFISVCLDFAICILGCPEKRAKAQPSQTVCKLHGDEKKYQYNKIHRVSEKEVLEEYDRKPDPRQFS